MLAAASATGRFMKKIQRQPMVSTKKPAHRRAGDIAKMKRHRHHAQGAAAPFFGVERRGNGPAIGQHQRTADTFDRAKANDQPQIRTQTTGRRADAEHDEAEGIKPLAAELVAQARHAQDQADDGQLISQRNPLHRRHRSIEMQRNGRQSDVHRPRIERAQELPEANISEGEPLEIGSYGCLSHVVLFIPTVREVAYRGWFQFTVILQE